MVTKDPVTVGTLLQLNSTILVGIFLFISLFPLSIGDLPGIGDINQQLVMINDISDDEENLIKSYSTLKSQLTSEKEMWEKYVKGNVTDSVKEVVNSILEVYSSAISNIDNLTKITKQDIHLKSESSGFMKNSQIKSTTGYVYWLVGGLSTPFGLSIILCLLQSTSNLFGKNIFKICKILTAIGIGLVILALIIVSNYNLNSSLSYLERVNENLNASKVKNMTIEFNELNKSLNIIDRIMNLTSS